MPSLSISVPFAKGKQRPRVTRNGTYTPRETKEAERVIAWTWMEAPGSAIIKMCPVSVRIEVYRELPKSKPKRIQSEPDTHKPDVDNIAKLVLDALNRVAWEDDAQVTELSVVKHPRTRGGKDHTIVTVGW